MYVLPVQNHLKVIFLAAFQTKQEYIYKKFLVC